MVIKIYTTPTCHWCHEAKQFLKSKKIKFQEIDVSKSEKAVKEMVAISGQLGTPTLDINGKIIVGFDEDGIKKALKIK